jgi:hypothetical protein
MVIKDGISLVISEFYTALVKDGDRPLRMATTAHLPSIETSLAKVVTEGCEDKALTRDTSQVVLKHGIQNLQ